MDSAIRRIPALAETGYGSSTTARRASHPDKPVPGWAQLPRSATSTSVRLQLGRDRLGGGAGRALAEWIVGGERLQTSPRSTSGAFAAFQRRQRLAALAGQRSARAALRDPVPNRENDLGPNRSGAHRSTMCSRRRTRPSAPEWAGSVRCSFAPAGETAALDYTWGQPDWLEWSRAEHQNTRENVTVFDQDLLLQVPGDRTGRRGRPAMALHSRRGGRAGSHPSTPGCSTHAATYESDLTVTRISAEEYFVVSSAATTERDQDHVRRNLPTRSRTRIDDGDRRLAVFRRDGPEVPRAAHPPERRRPRQPGLRLRHQSGDRACGTTVRATAHLRRRARLELYVPSGFAAGCTPS